LGVGGKIIFLRDFFSPPPDSPEREKTFHAREMRTEKVGFSRPESSEAIRGGEE